MIQRILASLSVILCIAVIIVGSNYWDAKRSKVLGESVYADSATEEEQGEKPDNEDKTESVIEPTLTWEELRDLVSHLPENVANLFRQSYNDKTQVKIMFVGSTSLGADNGWGKLVAKQLTDTYGEDLVAVSTVEFDGNSTDLVNSEVSKEVITGKPDLLFLEGFTLEDNLSIIPVEQSHDNLTSFIESVTKESAGTILYIQPPQPLYNAVNYPRQVAALKAFAAEQGYNYFDHWDKWPDSKDDQLLEYVEDGFPTKKGHQLWADAIIEFFVGK
ncbi:SGNH/GDSL hydrolase family protein [Bacillus kwashiorkori]|uniref:SGNH/GDSL hydrolase family protein n=1 Tax=Bacillus kwashiorkori TaxID=1522318 RepID=UPI000781C659|nr:SGNH/GDSL hydrolase family protein [Bacillus kwashiorkori]